MSYLPKFKIGSCDCGECAGYNVQGRKVGKEFMCMIKYNKMKTTEQIAKSIKRDDNRRALINSEPKIRSLQDKSLSDGYNELDRWFKERRKEMTGVCVNCGGRSCKDNDTYYKFSIAHLLPKSLFKSVATHPDNWLELCHFGQSCHAQMDNKMIDLIEMSCWDTIVTKFCKIYPHILHEERRRIPKILLDYIEIEK